DADVEAVELADCSRAVVAVDLEELDLNLGRLLERRLRREGGQPPLAEDDEVVEVRVRLALEEETPFRHRLELAQPRRTWADERRGDRRRELDAVRLRGGGRRARRGTPVRGSGRRASAGGARRRSPRTPRSIRCRRRRTSGTCGS